MRKHQGTFFNLKNGIYPTPQLASIEHQLWKAKQVSQNKLFIMFLVL